MLCFFTAFCYCRFVYLTLSDGQSLSCSIGVVQDLLAFVFFFQAEDGIRDLVRSRGLGDVYKRQVLDHACSVRARVRGFVALTMTALIDGDHPVIRAQRADQAGHPEVQLLSLIHISEPTRPY